MKVNLFSIFILFLASFATLANDEPQTPSVSALSKLAEDAVLQKLTVPDNAKINIQPILLDGRVSAPRCASAVTAVLATDRAIGRNNTVKLSCDSPDLDYPWQIYVSVKVDIMFPVVVANEILAAGDLVTSPQISIKYIEQSSLRGQQFADTDEIVGARVKRRVAKDAPIFANNLCFVCKGDTVSIYARSDAFTIKTLGEALSDGNLHDNIRVKNITSDKELDAQVSGIGEVEIKM